MQTILVKVDCMNLGNSLGLRFPLFDKVVIVADELSYIELGDSHKFLKQTLKMRCLIIYPNR